MSKFIKPFAALIILALLVFGIYQVFTFANRPLAEPLSLEPTTEPTQSEVVTPAHVEKTKPAEICGNTGSNTFLFTGTGIAGNIISADAIRILKVDYDQSKITVVAIPRDLWVNSGDPAVGENRLGLVYHYAKQVTNVSEKHKDTVATNTLAQVLQNDFGLTPDNYLTVNLDPWGEMIDTIGGVEVELPEEFVTTDGTVLPAGRQLLDGEKSQDYISMMLPGGDQDRIRRQNIFVTGLREKVLNFGIIAKVPELYKQFDKVIITDFSPKQLADMACLVEKVPEEQVFYFEITPDLVTVREDGALLPDKAKISAFLKQVLEIQ